MDTIDSLGFIEVYGLVTSIEAADAMLKSAQVRLLRQHEVRPGMITVVVEGDLASCRAAVNAGVAAAARVGTVIAGHVIGRPDTDTETLVLDVIPDPSSAVILKKKSGPGTKTAVALPRHKATEPAAAAKPKSAAAPAQTRKELDKAMTFIAGTAKGRSWSEIAKRFPEHAQRLHGALDDLVASGGLRKVGARYCKPEEKA